jgi:hypothetical protein
MSGLVCGNTRTARCFRPLRCCRKNSSIKEHCASSWTTYTLQDDTRSIQYQVTGQLCTVLDYIYITRWYTVHTISSYWATVYLVGLHIHYKMIHGPYNIKLLGYCVSCWTTYTLQDDTRSIQYQVIGLLFILLDYIYVTWWYTIHLISSYNIKINNPF